MPTGVHSPCTACASAAAVHLHVPQLRQAAHLLTFLLAAAEAGSPLTYLLTYFLTYLPQLRQAALLLTHLLTYLPQLRQAALLLTYFLTCRS